MNVNFKRGSQSALNTILTKLKNGTGTVEAGSFYLTEDTDRLYFAQSSTELVPLDQYIRVIENTSALPSAATAGLSSGDIYYITNGNILAIYDSSYQGPGGSHWVQLNPDTNNVLDATLSDLSVAYNPTTRTVTFTQVIVDSIGGSNTHTVTTSAGFIAGSNVAFNVSGSDKTVEISATDTTYAFGVAQETGSGNAKITITPTANGSAGTPIDIKFSGSGIALSADSSTKTITLSAAAGVSGVGTAFDNAGVFTTAVQTTDSTYSSSVTPTISYGYNETTSQPTASAVFANGTAVLDVYTRSELKSYISDQFRTFDAMTYKGVLNAASAATVLGTPGTSSGTYAGDVGDVWKVNGTISATASIPVSAKTGDLIIAKGTDGAVTWDVIDSGDDQFINVSADTNSLIIKDNTTNLGGIIVNGGTTSYGTINVSSSISDNINTLTVTHGAASTGTAVSYASATTTTTQAFGTRATLDIPTITGLSKDAAGHITSISTATYKVTDTHATLSSGATAIGVDQNFATVVTTISDTDSATVSPTFHVASDVLELTSSTVSIAGVSHDCLNINLVWGSFT